MGTCGWKAVEGFLPPWLYPRVQGWLLGCLWLKHGCCRGCNLSRRRVAEHYNLSNRPCVQELWEETKKPLSAQISALHKAVPAEMLDLSPSCSWECEEIHSFLNWVASEKSQRLWRRDLCARQVVGRLLASPSGLAPVCHHRGSRSGRNVVWCSNSLHSSDVWGNRNGKTVWFSFILPLGKGCSCRGLLRTNTSNFLKWDWEKRKDKLMIIIYYIKLSELKTHYFSLQLYTF